MVRINKLKVIELFGGIGAIRKALINSNIPYKIVDYVEIDKNCVQSYNALYDENYITKDIKEYSPTNTQKIDLIMHGSPCQDFSIAGYKNGGEKGSGTRSSLLFETIRIISEMNPKPTWVIWENVTGVLNKKMLPAFLNYLEELESLGYENKYDTLNAYNFGIPQKRNRVFVISKLGYNNFSFDDLQKIKPKHLNHYLELNPNERYDVIQPSILTLLSDDSSTKRIKYYKKRLRILNDFAYTISTRQDRIPNSGFIKTGDDKYRYLTERECFRLMGFSDSDINILETTHPRIRNCKSGKLYKQAGNSIVVNVLEEILKEVKRKS